MRCFDHVLLVIHSKISERRVGGLVGSNEGSLKGANERQLVVFSPYHGPLRCLVPMQVGGLHTSTVAKVGRPLAHNTLEC